MALAAIKCKMEYSKSAHLTMLYSGFLSLAKQRLIDLEFFPASSSRGKPVICAEFSSADCAKTLPVFFDALDGLNWIDGSRQENLQYFKENFKAGIYFKRSYSKILAAEAAPSLCILPMGLSFAVDLTPSIEFSLKDNAWILARAVSKIGTKRFTRFRDLVTPPSPSTDPRILFFAGLWDPDDVKSIELKEERERINNLRISIVEMCRQEFGSRFSGGLIKSAFSRRVAPELVSQTNLTKRSRYLSAVGSHDICIATDGLHGSVGWKFGEYVAKSRAIVTEPLRYVQPGNFEVNQNYLPARSADDFVEAVELLISSRARRMEMMLNNYRYQLSFVNPMSQALNVVLHVVRRMEEE